MSIQSHLKGNQVVLRSRGTRRRKDVPHLSGLYKKRGRKIFRTSGGALSFYGRKVITKGDKKNT